MAANPQEIVSEWDRLDSDRSTVKTAVQDVMSYVQPLKATITTKRVEGQPVHRELFDSTAETACQRFATGLYNHMWNPARPNFMLLPPIEDAPAAGEGARELNLISERVRQEMSRSNFEEAFYEHALDLGSAGRATMEPARGIDTLYEFSSHPFEEIVFAENWGGRVDRVLRRVSMTARQIVQEFGRGEGRVGKAIWDAYNEDGGRGRDKKFDLVHRAAPRTDFTAGGRDVRNMPIASEWVAVTDKHVLRESGWPQQRYLVCRFSKASGERDGRSPGMTTLPDVKMLNRIEESLIVGLEGAVRPTILAPDRSFVGTVKLRPGSIMYYRVNAAAPNAKPEPFNSGSRVDLGTEYAESKRDIIKRAFYNDLFLILTDDKARTATEVRSLLAEKLAMLGPSFGRMKVELFDPMIRVLLSILSEVPILLRGVDPRYLQMANIRYISTLAMAMEYAELSLIEDAMVFLSPLSEIEPTILDNLSFDEMTRGFLEKMAWPTKWLRSRSEVKALRDARMAYQAQQTQILMAQQQLEAAGKMTKRPEPGSPAEAMMAEAA